MKLFNGNGYPFFRTKRGITLLFIILLTSAIFGCLFGSTFIPLKDFIGGLLWQDGFHSQSVIIYYIRIPRVLAGLLAGIGLSISGVLLQTVTGNTLAGPNIIGVNAGAGFCCVVLLTFFPGSWAALPIVSFFGAFLTTLLILAVAKRVNASSGTVILAGIACTALLNAGISFLNLLDTDVLSSYNAFSVGGLRGVSTEQLVIPGAIIICCLIICLFLSGHIHLLSLGEPIARSLGVNTKRIQMLALVCASASAAAVVSYAGLLGFVGLVVPHIARRLCGSTTAPLLVVSSLVGATIVILADLFGRVILAPTEISVGILMALIGAPFFFVLLLKRRNSYD